MSPTRRDIIKAAGGLGALLALPQACQASEPVIAAPADPSPDSATRYEFIGVVLITNPRGIQDLYNRCVTFDVDDRDTVTITVHTIGRPEDDFTFQPGPTQNLANVLGEIQDYITEQQRRIDTSPDTIARREARRAKRRATTPAILKGGTE
ncbi:MAG: hypothetical protein M3457_20420 [Chloroflexota bacterium]|nr:hypothetical protein [Chloroflexota bacterium]